ncbi:hypothetical protein [Candidatus Absconditicoccus praedator]|uniref:hypothetical protein n=1 Tax=Candidatus Absconditicoccus praedator TaxID=2735562 RepID=UPI001E53A4C6|nr:hypothetical protein [Candidatus Absconditicoccus praedator]UFX83402.1 hypothetical protein HLG78_04715 [Candidatus Absconditicoccus praedator]
MYDTKQLEYLIKNSMLLTLKQRNKLLSKKWDERTKNFLSSFFKKYLEKEKKATNFVNSAKTMMTARTIRKIEQDYFEKVECYQIDKIETKIKKL